MVERASKQLGSCAHSIRDGEFRMSQYTLLLLGTSHVFETVFRLLFQAPHQFPLPSHECMNILGVVSTAQS
jgi:hypothetical protein